LDDSFLNWSIPENVGPIVNTAQWDGYFSVSAQGDYAYFSSVENSLGAEDIFRIKIPPKVKPLTLIQINGTVINEDSKEPILAKVLIRGQALADSMSVDFDPYNGDFSFMWPAKKPFLVEVKSKGFISKVERFDFSRESSFKTVTRQYALSALQLNKQFNLPTITFAQSKSELSPESFDEIDNIISILRENPGFGILLEGHTDNQGDWNENLKLSLSRVESVRDYLLLKGIRKDRIKVKGWGGTKPIMSNMVEERRKFNRRVEFTLYANE
jgi:outer membrane protein OmpA-like peptidoglycan-associated protein